MAIMVVGLRRYPVKSMGGEALERVDLDARGIAGDRWFAVQDSDGRFASGKTTRRFRRYDSVFDHRARTTSGGVIVRDADRSWGVGDPALDAHLTARMGRSVRVTPEDDVPHQDAGAVSLVGTATLQWCADRWNIDPDPRRLRVNIVVRTSEPFVEEVWTEHALCIGTAVLAVRGRAERCRMIDICQDGASPHDRWLTPLADERQMKLAVYADVAVPGTFAIGDTVTLMAA